MNASIAVVGDVHGDARRLRAMLAKLDSFRGHVVLVGDYVDGGPDSAEVLETLCSARARDPDRFTLLCGNHDLALLQYYEHGDFAAYAPNGGLATLASYLPMVTEDVWREFRLAIPAAHVALLRELRGCWESNDVLVSHVGFDPTRPHARDLDTMTHAAGWPIFGATSTPRPLVVCGHYAQRGARAYSTERIVCVDTGCGMRADGVLTAVLLPERTFLTA